MRSNLLESSSFSFTDKSAANTTQAAVSQTNYSEIKNETNLFSIFNELSGKVPPISFVVFCSFVIQIVQMTAITYKSFDDTIWYTKSVRLFMHQITEVVCFGVVNLDGFYKYIPGFCLVVINSIQLILLLNILYYYKVYRAFRTISLRLARFFFTYLNSIIFLPTAFMCGYFYKLSLESGSSMDIVSTVLLFGALSISMVMLVLDLMFRQSTILIENTILSGWSYAPLLYSLITSAMRVFFTFFIWNMPYWTLVILSTLYTVSIFFIQYCILTFPFIRFHMHMFFLSYLFFTQFASIFSLVTIVPCYYRLIIPLCIFILAYIGSYVFIRRYFLLSRVLLDISSRRKAMRALSIIFSTRPDLFVTWETFNAVAYNYKEDYKVLLFLARLCVYFSSKSHALGRILYRLSKVEMNFFENFLIMQIKKQYVQRESWATKQASSDLNKITSEIKAYLVSINKLLIAFAENKQNINYDYFVGLAQLRKKTESSIREALNNHPNNSMILLEYSKYLLECCSNYTDGIFWNNKSKAVDTNRKNNVDQSFQRLAGVLPRYSAIVKMELVHYDHRNHSKTSDSMSVISSSDTSLWKNSSMGSASEIVENARTKIALQKGIEKTKSQFLTFLNKHTTIIIFTLVIVFSTFLSIAIYQLVDIASRNQISLDFSEFYELYGRIYFNHILKILSYYNLSSFEIANFYSKGEDYTYNFTTLFLYKFLDYSGVISSSQILKDNLLTRSYPFNFFYNDTYYTWDMLSVEIIFSNIMNLFDANFVDEVFYLNPYYISAFNNFWVGENSLNDESLFVTIQLVNETSIIDEKISKTAYSVIFSLYTFLTVISVYMLYLYYKEQKSFLYVLGTIQNDALKRIAKPIIYKEEELIGINWTVEQCSKPKRTLFAINIVSPIIFCSLLMLFFMFLTKIQRTMSNIYHWIILSSSREPIIYQSLFSVSMILFNRTFDENVSWLLPTAFSTKEESLGLVASTHQKLVNDSPGYSSLDGFSKKIDDIHYKATCDINSTLESDWYKCSSLDNLIVYLTNSLYNAHRKIYTGSVSKSDIDLILDLSINHIFPKIDQIRTLLLEEMGTVRYQYVITLAFAYISAVLLLILYYWISKYVFSEFALSFKVYKSILCKIPPDVIAENRPILNIIVNKPSVNIVKCDLYESVVLMHNDPILVLYDENICYMNTSASKVFGFTRERMTGQKIDLLIPGYIFSNDKRTVSITKEGNIEIKMEYFSFEQKNSTIVILHDITKRNRYQQISNEYREQTNRILNSLVAPKLRNIENKIVAFESKYVVVICIKISSLQSYAGVLTPQTLLKYIEAIMNGFENIRMKYGNIDMISIRGDCYTVAAGIYETEIDQNKTNTDVLSFVYEAFKSLEEVNNMYETSLCVKVGICEDFNSTCGLIKDPYYKFFMINYALPASTELNEKSNEQTILCTKSFAGVFDKSKFFTVKDLPTQVISGKEIDVAEITFTTP